MIKRPKQVERSQKSYLSNERYQDYAEQQFKTIYDYLDGEEEKNNYSTDEVKIGTWFGKDLYRKSFTRTDTTNFSLDIPNLDEVVDVTCLSRQTSDNGWRNIPWLYVLGNTMGNYKWAGGFYIESGEVKFQLGSNLASVNKLNFTIKYTKND